MNLKNINMYNDPLLTTAQNQNNQQRIQGVLENSTIQLTNPDQNKSDDQFMSELLKHCSGLRAMESYEQPNK